MDLSGDRFAKRGIMMRRLIKTWVNGDLYEVEVQPNWRLLDLLREGLSLTGTKEGCGEGMCGACTVIMDGKAVRSCLVLASWADGARVTTIEGLTDGGDLTPIQRAFLEKGAFQCGFCAPGMVMTSKAFLDESADFSEDEAAHAISGNICRCAGYSKIIEAIMSLKGSGG